METYRMTANFYPAKEAKNGYIGFADLTIADAIRIRGIAVFEDREGSGHHIDFPSFGEKDTSFVVPSSKEAYGQMLDVIEKAVKDENHFGWTNGKMHLELSISGRAVNESHADGRYTLTVADVCALRGISSQEVEYTKDGRDSSFVAINVPTLPPYEKDGEKVYPPIFEGLKRTYEKDGKEETFDNGLLIRNLVRSKRKELLEREPLDKQVSDASQKAAAAAPAGKEAPGKEASR